VTAPSSTRHLRKDALITRAALERAELRHELASLRKSVGIGALARSALPGVAIRHGLPLALRLGRALPVMASLAAPLLARTGRPLLRKAIPAVALGILAWQAGRWIMDYRRRRQVAGENVTGE